MEDHQIISCTESNVQKLEEIEALANAMVEIEGVDPRLTPFILEYVSDLRHSNLRAKYQAQLRTTQKLLTELS